MDQICWRDPRADNRHYIRLDTLYLHLPLGQKDIGMTHYWVCKELFTVNDQQFSQQSSHMILNEQNHIELCKTLSDQRVKKQVGGNW